MNKTEAIAIFGTTVADLARALGVTRSAVSQWPFDLRPEQVDRVIGAGVRLGRIKVTVGETPTLTAGPADERVADAA